LLIAGGDIKKILNKTKEHAVISGIAKSISNGIDAFETTFPEWYYIDLIFERYLPPDFSDP
jgi:hypothetical protein